MKEKERKARRETDEANGCSLGCFYERMYATDICTHSQTDTDAQTHLQLQCEREREGGRERYGKKIKPGRATIVPGFFYVFEILKRE